MHLSRISDRGEARTNSTERTADLDTQISPTNLNASDSQQTYRERKNQTFGTQSCRFEPRTRRRNRFATKKKKKQRLTIIQKKNNNAHPKTATAKPNNRNLLPSTARLLRAKDQIFLIGDSGLKQEQWIGIDLGRTKTDAKLDATRLVSKIRSEK